MALTGLLNERLGLPSVTGDLMSYDALYTFKTYDTLKPNGRPTAG